MLRVTVIVVERGMTGPEMGKALGLGARKPYRVYRVKMEQEEVERMIAERRRAIGEM